MKYPRYDGATLREKLLYRIGQFPTGSSFTHAKHPGTFRVIMVCANERGNIMVDTFSTATKREYTFYIEDITTKTTL